MREFDSNGLLIAEHQGKLFEASTSYLNCSSNIFIRRFLNSSILKTYDKNLSHLISYDVVLDLKTINEEFGDSSYGQVKYNKDAMFWLGYLYRYISYTRGITTKLLFTYFDYKKVIKLYYVYHTQSMEWCVSSLLELFGYTEKIFDKNYRIKDILRQKYLQNL